MPKTSRTPKAPKTAQELLTKKHEFYNSWAAVSDELGGLNRGLLSAISRGKKKAPPSVLHALGLPAHITIRAVPCASCGEVKTVKRCPCRNKPAAPRVNWKKAYIELLDTSPGQWKRLATWAASMLVYMEGEM